MASIEQSLLQQIMPEEANRPVMGEGHYQKPQRGRAGWDYDTLLSALTEMGHPNLDMEMSEDRMDQVLQALEAGGAVNNDQAIPILAALFEQMDPNNKFAGHLPAEVEDSPGYWDAANMGNGDGQSFIHYPPGPGEASDLPDGDGRYVRADPVGNGAPSREGMRGKLEAVADGHQPGIGDMDQAQLINAFLEAFGGR